MEGIEDKYYDFIIFNKEYMVSNDGYVNLIETVKENTGSLFDEYKHYREFGTNIKTIYREFDFFIRKEDDTHINENIRNIELNHIEGLGGETLRVCLSVDTGNEEVIILYPMDNGQYWKIGYGYNFFNQMKFV